MSATICYLAISMYYKLDPSFLDPAYKVKDCDKAKGTGTSMSLCVTMQVFDSGLIGEGVLHMLAAAKQKLLTKDAILVPAAATVFCQPLQMRVGQASTVSSLSPLVVPLLPFLFAHPSLPFPLCLSLSAFPFWWSLSCCYCQAMQMQFSCR